MNSMVSLILITIGVLFNLLGCIGIIRLPDTYKQIAGSNKSSHSGMLQYTARGSVPFRTE